ncbi:MAG: hypothetical protein AAF939_04045 [Planctomycetota bacterium]
MNHTEPDDNSIWEQFRQIHEIEDVCPDQLGLRIKAVSQARKRGYRFMLAGAAITMVLISTAIIGPILTQPSVENTIVKKPKELSEPIDSTSTEEFEAKLASIEQELIAVESYRNRMIALNDELTELALKKDQMERRFTIGEVSEGDWMNQPVVSFYY